MSWFYVSKGFGKVKTLEHINTYGNGSYGNRQDNYPVNGNSTIEKKEYGLSRAAEDRILDEVINRGIVDARYKLYFVKVLKRIGPAQFMVMAERAAKLGKNPQKYFTSLVK